ncbi:50S ribosomal protein L31 [Buchnera aphidicola (Pterocallis alni)]|uniref:50S ribosomal protein L31 n=1 Tax=Buchnera aphidicola TaxID=9 RepID=UPI003463B829
MKKGIHPKYSQISAKCVCGNTMILFSTLNQELLNIDICYKCHPFYTGQQRVLNKGGRIERFNKKFFS